MKGKHQDIAEAADRLFYREGFAGVGIDRVVEEAGVALGTLYRHFDSRSHLVAGVLAHRHVAYFEALESGLRPARGAGAVLELFDVLEAWSAKQGGNGCLFLRAAADHPKDAAVRRAALAHKRSYLALVERRLREGGWAARRAKALAPSLFLLLEGAVAAAFTLGDRVAIAEARKAAAVLLAAQEPIGPKA